MNITIELSHEGIAKACDMLEVVTMFEKLSSSQKKILIDSMAKVLNVHRNTVQNKLDGESEFTIGQAQIISETMFPEYTMKYLFHRNLTAA